LEILASTVKEDAVDLICPMIDARRMEVFTACYSKDLKIIKEPFATILTPECFSDILLNRHVLFTGNGSGKFETLVKKNDSIKFLNKKMDSRDMLPLSLKQYRGKNFVNVAYSSPYYVKDVYIAGKD